MTPTELATEVEKLRARFLETANQKIGLSNYQMQLRQYQRMVLDMLTLLRQMALLIGQAPSQSDNEGQSS